MSGTRKDGLWESGAFIAKLIRGNADAHYGCLYTLLGDEVRSGDDDFRFAPPSPDAIEQRKREPFIMRDMTFFSREEVYRFAGSFEKMFGDRLFNLLDFARAPGRSGLEELSGALREALGALQPLPKC